MPFVSDAEIEKETKKQVINNKIEAKREQHMIADKASQEKNPKMDEQEFLKEIEKVSKKQPAQKQPKPPKPITLKEVEEQLKIRDLIQERGEKEIEDLLDQEEIREIKGELLGLMALTQNHPDKRKIFHHKLKNSETVNNYVNNNFVLRFFNKANSHVKFGTVYAIKYLQTEQDYAGYLKELAQIQLLKNAEIEKAKEKPVDVPKESNVDKKA